MVIAQHQNKTNERYTPGDFADAARNVMGGIDLDPASSFLANQTIKAKKYFGTGKRNGKIVFVDGFWQKWRGRVWLNPPGGRAPAKNPAKTMSNATLWWWRLANAWKKGDVTEAIFLGFTLEILRTGQTVDAPHPSRFPLCFPIERICFATPSETDEDDRPTAGAERVESEDPTHGNVLVYLPPRTNARHVSLAIPKVKLFENEFSKFGDVRV